MAVKLEFDLKNIKIDKPGFDYVFNEPAGAPVGRWMNRRGKLATRAAKTKVGVHTGALRASITMQHDRKGVGRQQQIKIGTSIGGKKRGYALYHHEGTRAHSIRAKDGRMMSFTVRGKRVYARQVRHPAKKGNPYLTYTFTMFMGP